MSAAATVPDSNLEERLYALQKVHRGSQLQHILDEALQLYGAGRNMEAGALVEKVEAMGATARTAVSAPAESAASRVVEAAPNQNLATELVSELANGLATVLVGAIGNFEKHITGESRRLTASFSERLDKLHTAVEGLQPLNGRIDQLIQAELAAQDRYEHLARAVTNLEQADARHESVVSGLSGEFREFANSTSHRMNELWGRIEGQERTLSEVNTSLSGVAGKVAAAAERLERHAEAIRSVHQIHKEREQV